MERGECQMFGKIKEILGDIKMERDWGSSWRFIIANLILSDELRSTLAFARIDIASAIKYMNVNPDFANRRLKKAYKDLSILGEFKNIEIKE